MSICSRTASGAAALLLASMPMGAAQAAPLFPQACFFLDQPGLCQEVSVTIDGAGGSATDEDLVAGTTEADINRNILATQTVSGGRGTASAGIFGAVGLEGLVSNSNVTHLAASAEIRSSQFQNLTGSAAHATGFFIIDGGEMTLIAGEGSTLSYGIGIQTTYLDSAGDPQLPPILEENGLFVGFGGEFHGSGELRQTATGVELSPGADLGVTRDPRRSSQFDIPLSLQMIDFGIVPNGWFLDITYTAEFQIDVVGFAEAIHFAFSDPLQLRADVNLFPTVSFAALPGTTIPEPATLLLLGAGLAILPWLRRDRG